MALPNFPPSSSHNNHFNDENDDFHSEITPLLPNMVSEKISISQQVLVSQSSLSSARKGTQYLAALIATLGGLLAGLSLGWTSPTSEALEKGDYGISISKNDMAWIGSFMPLGAIVGSIITASLVNLLGRKNLILLMIVPCIIGWSLMAFANSVIIFCIGRFLTGLATGSYCIVVPMYTAEIAEKDIRGTLGTYLQLQITIGILLTYIIGSFVNVFTLTIICGVIPLVYAILMFMMPETPYFHLMKKNDAEAKQSLAYFRGPDYDGQQELLIMQHNIEEDAVEKVNYMQAFQTKAAKRGLLIGLGVMFLQQFSGCNAVIFYTKSIFKDAGAPIDPNLCIIVVGVVQVIATYISSLMIDRLGRRILLLLSIVIMTICTFTLGLYFYLKTDAHQDVSNLSWLPLASVCSYIIIFSLGFGPIPWMLMAEIFPCKIRGTACSLACLFNWSCVFVITKLFPLFVSLFGAGLTFWCFTVCSAVGIFFVLIMVPETKGKSLMEVQQILGGGEINACVKNNQYTVEAPFSESKIKV